jgi:hypothetical protein
MKKVYILDVVISFEQKNVFIDEWQTHTGSNTYLYNKKEDALRDADIWKKEYDKTDFYTIEHIKVYEATLIKEIK